MHVVSLSGQRFFCCGIATRVTLNKAKRLLVLGLYVPVSLVICGLLSIVSQMNGSIHSPVDWMTGSLLIVSCILSYVLITVHDGKGLYLQGLFTPQTVLAISCDVLTIVVQPL